VHPKLFPRWLVMSPNATLLAYTGPANIKELRDQAALVSILWKEAELKFKPTQSHPSLSESTSSSSTVIEGCLETLTIETDKANIIVRAIQPRLLLVLVGGIPPRRKDHSFKVTPETRGSTRYPPTSKLPTQPSSDSLRSSPSSNSPSEEHKSPRTASAAASNQQGTAKELFKLDEDIKFGLLHIQRKKIDAATEHMRLDFQSKGFVMPNDSSIP